MPDVDFKKMLNKYYKDKNYKKFVILYLLIHYNTRNRDLIVKVVKDESELNKTDNFLWIIENDVVYIRNDYKTASRYGIKREVIKAKKFFNAVQDLESLLIDNNNLDRQVKEATGGINQSTMSKMSVASNNNLKSIAKATKNRGTNFKTIVSNYDIS